MASSRIFFALVAILVMFWAGCGVLDHPGEKSQRQPIRYESMGSHVRSNSDEEILTLINNLQHTVRQGLGYGVTLYRLNCELFVPLDGRETEATILLDTRFPGGDRCTFSKVLAQLIAKGAAPIPSLLAHLNDSRLTGIAIERNARSYVGGMVFEDYYDRNTRASTLRQPASIVQEPPTVWLDDYTVTVGDLCFVALGQILNRSFNTVWEQPTNKQVISSPTHSSTLCSTLREEWSNVTPDRHLASLIRDLKTPDSNRRRVGALRRILFYYPEHAEEVVRHELLRPMYCLATAREFLRGEIYPEKDPVVRQARHARRILKHGPQFSDGVCLCLIEDCRWEVRKRQAEESLRLLYPGTQPPQWLNDSGNSVGLSDLGSVSVDAQAQFIDGLGGFKSEVIDETVEGLLLDLGKGYYNSESEANLVSACIRRLKANEYSSRVQEWLQGFQKTR
jgi:hypothetical protein